MHFLKIGTKIHLLGVLTFLSMSVVIGFGLRQIHVIGDATRSMAREDIPLMESLGKISSYQMAQVLHMERAMNWRKLDVEDRFQAERAQIRQLGRRIDAEIEKGKKIIASKHEGHKPAMQQEFSQVDYHLRSLHQEQAEYDFLAERIFNLLSLGKREAANQTLKTLGQQDGKITGTLQNIVATMERFAQESTLQAEKRERAAMLGMLWISVTALLLTLGLGYFIAQSIKKPITVLRDAAVRIGRGELDADIAIASTDEMGELAGAFRKMAGDLNLTTVSRNYVDNILQSMIDTLVVLREDGSIVSVNQETCRLLGYEEKELLGRPVGVILAEAEETTEAFAGTKLQDVIRKGTIRDLALDYRTKSGAVIPMSFSGAAMHGPGGKFAGIVGVARDMRQFLALTEQAKQLAATEAAAREAERRVHAVSLERNRLDVTLQSIGDGVIATDARGRVEFLNLVAEQLTGWRTEEAKGKELQEVFRILNKKTRKAFRNPVDEVLADGAIVTLANHTVLIARDGAERDIADSAAPIRNRHGAILGVVLVFRDVTEKEARALELKEAYLALEASNRKLHHAFTEHKKTEAERILLATAMQSIAEGIMITDRQGVIQYVNAAYERVTGLSEADAIGNRPNILKSGRHGETFYRNMWRTIVRGDVWQGTVVNKRRDGTLFDAEEVIASVKDASGRITHFVAVIRDVTQRNLDAEKMYQLASFSSQNPQPIMRIDAHGVLRYANEQSAPLLRRWHCEIGRIVPEDVQRIVRNVLETGVKEEVIRQVDDQYFALMFTPIAEEAYVNIYGRNITRNKLDEAKLLQSNLEIENVNRKLKENQAQLIQAGKMAGLGQLAAGVAHEINNPVGFVTSNLGTLKEYIDAFRRLINAYGDLARDVHADMPDDYAGHLRRIEAIREEEDIDYLMEDVGKLLLESIDGTHRVKEIVMHLKSFARLDEAEASEADINDGIESTLKVVWNELKYKCKVHKNLSPLPLIPCYPGQLNQVFMNLLVNAAHAIEEKGEITIETETVDDHVVVRISDTGSGIPPELHDRIFDPFFTTKDVGKGTGMGLSIVHGILEKHHGTIEVESAVGKGTTFTIRLPVRGIQ